MAGGKDGSVAPKERINIKYVPATGDQQEEIELPLRLMMLGNYFGREDDTPVEDRKVISVDKNSFDNVLADAGIERELTFKNTLVDDDDDASLTAKLSISSMKDFEPDALVRKVPELASLADLREALVALKGPLGNIPAFRKRLEQLLQDEGTREKLLAELDASDTEAEPTETNDGDDAPEGEN